MAALFHASDMAFQALKFAGVAYLLFMAWSMLRAKGALGIDQDRAMLDARQVIGKPSSSTY